MSSKVRWSTTQRTGPPRPASVRTSRTALLRLLGGAPVDLQIFWFVTLAVLFMGFLVLEVSTSGSGMLMASSRPAARAKRVAVTPTSYRRAVLNTIGPVWDGNEVWLITAGGAMFAAFPGMYATMFSGLYLPLLAILVAHDRACAAPSNGAARSTIRAWRRRADIAIAVGSWVPAVLWGVAFATLVRGLPVDAEHQMRAGRSALCSTPYTLLGGLSTLRVVPAARGGVRDAENRRRGA